MANGYCSTHGAYSTTSDYCPQCGSHARLIDSPSAHPLESFRVLPTFQPFDRGWICPKCERVYGPSVSECYRCNSPLNLPSVDAPDSLAPQEGTHD